MVPFPLLLLFLSNKQLKRWLKNDACHIKKILSGEVYQSKRIHILCIPRFLLLSPVDGAATLNIFPNLPATQSSCLLSSNLHSGSFSLNTSGCSKDAFCFPAYGHIVAFWFFLFLVSNLLLLVRWQIGKPLCILCFLSASYLCFTHYKAYLDVGNWVQINSSPINCQFGHNSVLVDGKVSWLILQMASVVMILGGEPEVIFF